ncbi:E3 ubiquitin-protein ligase [Spironucleus salmonicida]|uniref:E3 ubiquitin-protein ligase n=1 Tax=Spironucleus salmonicida TaxID=348837 RepID=V6LLY9_9EUKA|nr:E3 ubiquitin-protein ligase [Spironucleus salmonicida]|eukprot:EST45233.1 Putative zinc finger in N-recognin (UBR box) domain-containing protein [Spironucleus salmonicida]
MDSLINLLKKLDTPLVELQQYTEIMDLDFRQDRNILFKSLQINKANPSTRAQLSNQLQKSVCGKPLNNCVGIKCQTCSNDLASVICLECFDETKHVGHKYTYLTANGMCDCGFACTIKPEGFCDKHCGNHVIRDFHDEKLIFDEQMCVKVIYTLCCLIAHHLVSGNSARYQDVCSVLKTILYEYPVDFLKSIFTKCLFIDPGKSRMQDFLDFGNFENHILPYHNFYELRQTVHQTGFKHYPLICIISQSEEFIPGLGDQDIAHLLVEYQISEPNFRSLMMYAFYMRYQDLIASCFTDSICTIKQTNGTLMNIFNQKIELVRYQYKNIKFKKQIWCSAPVQLDSNIQLDSSHSIMINFLEQSSYTLAQYNGMLSQKSQDYEISFSFLQNFFNSGIQELLDLFLLSETSPPQNLVKELSILFNNLLQFHRQLPSMSSYDKDLTNILINIDFQSNMKYSLQTLVYSMKNTQFDGQLCRYKLSILPFCFFLSNRAFIETIRVRDKKVIQSDATIKKILEQLFYGGKQYYDYTYEIFTSIVYGFRTSTYNFQSSICRVNDDFDSVDLTKNRDFQKQIDNVVQLSTYFLLAYSLNQRFQFCYSNNNVYPQIPYGFGLHTQIPILETDMIQVDHDVLHPLDNQLVIMLSFGLQAYYLYQKQGMFEKPHYEYLKDVVGSIEYTRSLPRYNMPVIAAWAMRTIVSVGLLEGGFFKSLIDIEEYIKCILFQHSRVQYYNPMYHHFVLLQSILLGCKNDQYNTNQFIHQMGENYGFINPIQNQFFEYHKLEDKDKLFILKQHFVKALLQITFKEQMFQIHSDIKIKYILAFLLINDETKPSKVYGQFKYNDFYNSEIFESLLLKIATLSTQQDNLSQFYKSSNNSVYWEINQNGLAKLSIFDSFCANIPQFLSTFKTQALKYKVPILPADTFDAPFDRELADQIFTNQHVYDVIFFLVKTGFVDGTFKSSNVINDIYVLLGFKQLIIHNADDLELKKLFNLIPKDQSLYQDQVWIVLQNLMDYQHQEKKSVNKISLQAKLAQLKSKVAPTYDLIQEIKDNAYDNTQFKAQDQLFIKQLHIINEFQPNCQVCQDICTDDSTLCILGTCTPTLIDNKPGAIGQTCTHAFHFDCIRKEVFAVKCPICRCLSTTLFPIAFSQDTQECLNVIDHLIQSISFAISQKYTDFSTSPTQLLSFSHITDNSFSSQDIEESLILINLLLMTAYQQLRAIISRINADDIENEVYKRKQYQIVLLTSHSCIISAQKIYEFISKFNVPVITEQYDILSLNLFNCLILNNKTQNPIIQQLQRFYNDPLNALSIIEFETASAYLLNQQSYRFLVQNLTFQIYLAKLKFSLLFSLLQNSEIPQIDITQFDLKIYNFPDHFAQLLKHPPKCKCGKSCTCFCIWCGTGFCATDFDDFSHICQYQQAYYFYKQNILVFTEFYNSVYFSGGPYLDDNGEDDIERQKNIPLYLSQKLIGSLKTHFLYCNSRQMNAETGLPLSRFSDLMVKWGKE